MTPTTAAVDWAARHGRGLWGAALLLFLGALFLVPRAPLDALPDLADPQVVVGVEWPREAARIDARVVAPLAQAFLGIDGVRSVRATSHLGLAFIYVVAAERQRLADIRRAVTDRLQALRPGLPTDARITLGPDAGAAGWIYQYALVDRQQRHDLRELRHLHRERVIPILQRVPGVAEVANVGGLEKQVVLRLYPPLLAAHGISVGRVAETLRALAGEGGGRSLELTGRDYQLRVALDSPDPNALAALVVGTGRRGETVRLGDLGYFQVDFDQRRGIVDLDGRGEVVGGIVVMAQDGNVLRVRSGLTEAIAQAARALPPGVEIVPTYDRARLVRATLRSFLQTLGWELLLVVLVMLAALRHPRAAAATVAVLLLGLAGALTALVMADRPIDLVTLVGLALAIGVMADAALVMVEHAAATLGRHPRLQGAARRRLVLSACAEMMRPLALSMAIVLLTFLPIFFLGEREMRLFEGLVWAKTLGMGFSTLLTLLLLPAATIWALGHGRPAAEGRRWLRRYRRCLAGAVRRRRWILGLAGMALLVALVQLGRSPRAYLPELDEGALLYMPVTLPGLPLREAGWLLQNIDARLAAFPEVERVFGKLGRAETFTDPAPVTMIEVTLLLRPPDQWRPGMDRARLLKALDAAMDLPGYRNIWTQPIAGRALMQSTGIQTPLGLKLRGPEANVLERLSREAETLLIALPGAASVAAERIASGDYLDVRLDAARLGREGVTLREALDTVHYALGAAPIIRLPGADAPALALRYAPEYLDTLAKVQALPVLTADRNPVPLSRLADVAVRARPEMVRNDDGQRAAYVFIHLADGVSASDFVARATPYLRERLDLPAGYHLSWSGTALALETARPRLLGAAVAALAMVVILLLVGFRRPHLALAAFLAIPFSLAGGTVLQALLGLPVTTALIVGHVAAAGVAVQTSILVLVFIQRAARRPRYTPVQAVLAGAAQRLRPKTMTVATTVLGLLPVLFSDNAFAVALAAPIVGGVAASALYALLILPTWLAGARAVEAR